VLKKLPMHVHARQLPCSNPYLPQGNSSALKRLLHPSLLKTFRWSAGAKAPIALSAPSIYWTQNPRTGLPNTVGRSTLA
jgi:hypothetical protein